MRTRFEVLVGLGLIIMLLSIIPAYAADIASPSATDRAVIQQPTQSQLERGQTNDEYGALALHARAGMSNNDEGYVSAPSALTVSGINEPTPRQLFDGQTSNEYGTLVLHARAGMTGY